MRLKKYDNKEFCITHERHRRPTGKHDICTIYTYLHYIYILAFFYLKRTNRHTFPLSSKCPFFILCLLRDTNYETESQTSYLMSLMNIRRGKWRKGEEKSELTFLCHRVPVQKEKKKKKFSWLESFYSHKWIKQLSQIISEE